MRRRKGLCRSANCAPSVLERLEPRVLFATFVVTNTNDSGPGSLRDALSQANNSPGNTISFNIPTTDPGYNLQFNQFTIHVKTSLPPVLSEKTTIDGSTEPGATPDVPPIVIDGGQLTSGDP